jgi:hypothetical protein
MKCIPVILAIVCSLPLRAQNTPSFDEVVKMFFSKYAWDKGPDLAIKFQKKKNGWFTVLEDINKPAVYQDVELFWSAEKGSCLPLKYPLSEDTGEQAVRRAIDGYKSYFGMDGYSEYGYAHYVYYGYLGWDLDIIEDFGQQRELGDTLLESLGKAYTNYATGFFYDPYGDLSNPEDPDRKKLSPGGTPGGSRKNKFIEYERKAIEAYRRLSIQDSDYQTMVGNSRIKYANEYIFAYSTLLFNGYEAAAKEFLTPKIYPDSLLNEARSYLDGVGKNGILITWGDNDTYPLWYLQQTEQYRKDVIVVNYNLLGLQKYIAYLDRQYKGSLFKTPPANYLNPNFYYAKYEDQNPSKQPVELGAFLDSMNIFYKDTGARKFYCKELFIDLKGIRKNGFLPGHAILKIKLDNYFLMTDFMVMDLFNTNYNKRPFCFTIPDFPFFTGYLKQQGKVYYVSMD